MYYQYCPAGQECDDISDYTFVPMSPASGSENLPIFGINTGPLYQYTPRFTVNVDVVSNDNGDPIEGARVTMRRYGLEVGEALTNSLGECRIVKGAPADGFYSVVAEYGDDIQPGFAGVLSGIETIETTIEVSPGAQITGKIQDAFGTIHYPISQANVFVYEHSVPDVLVWSGTTDDYGNFAFAQPGTGTFEYDVEVRGQVGTESNALVYRRGTFAPIQIDSESEGGDLGILRLKSNVVVLAHGVRSNAANWTNNGYPQALRGAGWAVLDNIDFPGSIGNAHGLTNITTQAQELENRINATRAWSVNIVAHSQGGLVSRYLNERMEGSLGRVDKLITLATPHHGSPLAMLPGGIQYLVTAPMRAYYPQWRTMNLAELYQAVTGVCAAFLDLIPNSGFMRDLNQGNWWRTEWSGNCFWHDPPNERHLAAGTSYLTIRGSAWGADPIFVLPGEWMGLTAACWDSDGIVPTESAWLHQDSGGNVYNYTTEDLNVDDVHHKDFAEGIVESSAIRAWVIARLAQNSDDWPATTSDNKSDTTKDQPAWTPLTLREMTTTTATSPRDSVVVDACDSLSVTWSWFDGDIGLTLTDPNAATIDSTTAPGDPDVDWTINRDYAFGRYVIRDPDPGTWYLQTAGTGTTADQNVVVNVASAGSVRYSARIESDPAEANADRVVLVELLDPAAQPVLNASVGGQWVGPTGLSDSLVLYDDGNAPDLAADDGIYAGLLVPESAPGVTTVALTATGSAPLDFTRSGLTSFVVGRLLDVAVVGPELTASSVNNLPFSPVTLATSVSNSGTEAAEVQVTFVLEGTLTVLETNNAVIPATSTESFTATHLPLANGSYDYLVYVTPLGDYADTDALNNEARTSLHIGDAAAGIGPDEDEFDLGRDLPEHLGNRNAAIVATYPNPFNPEIVLEFAQKTEGPAVVRIYDLRGRMVRDLRAGFRGPGRHSLTWDGKDDRGQRAAAGVYFVYLKANAEQDIRKIVMVK